ncbi:hypothetical protein WY02_00225 [Pseudonocardia sp. AL041005-10]|nr:hypothetical protein WY02_00225 [Pseudonocardia sp. AL041005-10]
MSDVKSRSRRMTTDVVVVGAGPTGLMLACELRLGGAEVVVVDRLPGRTGESRAGGLHSRTLEVLDQRGIVNRFLDRGQVQPVGHFSGLQLEFEPFDSRHPLPLMILQSAVEEILEQWALELGVHLMWSAPLHGLQTDEEAVDVVVGDSARTSTTVRARWVVGCDGGRSAVRAHAGIGFPGTPATMTAMIGDVELPGLPEDYVWVRRTPHGDFSVIAFEPGWYRVITSDHDRVPDRTEPATFEQLRASLVRHAGTDYGMCNPRWVSRFGDAARQADHYRSGRVFLAGDAAHIHYPAGGQGLNLGVQDAVNLGWKLAGVIAGRVPESVLDTYHDERHPVAARVLENTRAQLALARPGPHVEALRQVFASLIAFDEVNRHLAGMLTGLDVRYPTSVGHPLAGRRIPDIDLLLGDTACSAHELLHDARPVLLDLRDHPCRPGVGAVGNRVRVVHGRSPDATWPVPAVGDVPAPSMALVRPDGHVAWAADASDGGETPEAPGLQAALTRWFGPGPGAARPY